MNSATTLPQPAAAAGPGWLAQLQLRFAERNGRTYLAQRRHIGPLLVQRPFHPEGNACHVYVVHPPGGVVSGDQLQLDVAAGPATHVLLTTPAATKFYRSDGRRALQAQRMRATDGVVEWLPQEAIFYRGASVRSETRVDLNGTSAFFGWEIPCLGMPARGETFDSGELRLSFELWRDGTPLVLDLLRIDGNGAARQAAWGLNGHQAIGTLFAYPATREVVELARNVAAPAVEFAVTLVDDVLVCRCVCAQAEPVKRLFVALWQLLRPALLGRPAVLPRIWAT